MRHSRPAEPAGGLTVDRTLAAGEVLRKGTVGPYRSLVDGPGEAHLVREELAAAPPSPARGSAPVRAGRRTSLLAFAHVTDLQLADVQSPGRFEYCNRHVDDPRFRHLVPMHRPQEALTARAVDAMVGTLNSVRHAPVGGGEVELVVTTGDAVDNAQWNEVRMFLALLEGGRVRPGSGGARYEGVQSPAWGDDGYWRPDGGPGPGDWYQQRYGFPHLPGLLERALADFRAGGLGVPWLACFGNHEVLVQGVGRVTDGIQRALVGARKTTGAPVDLDLNLDLETLHELFIASPERFLSGHQHAVTADPDRRAVTRQEFVEAHFSSLSRPTGHGFTAANRLSGTAYYAYDVGVVRFICLDTTRQAGASHGCLDEDQLSWLRDRLEEVHSEHLLADGTTVRPGHDDRLVVVFSHHGLDTMTNLGVLPGGPDEPRLAGGAELREVLHRFGNVVAWVNGHTHRNRVTPRPDPLARTAGFWEIATSALMDWPCQARLVELLDNGDGTVSLVCTMVDHDGVVRPDHGSPRSGPWLAGLHRELAANEPWRGLDAGSSGRVADRNVDLRLPMAFPVR